MTEIKGMVSVTIPFHNAELFLADAIESVIAQTYPHWELFLVDDGSADRSAEIARRYEARFSEKIRYLQHFQHRNLGVTSTRNLGAKHSRGQYLAFLDSDDVWLPHKLEHQVGLMEEHSDAGLIYGPSEYWYDTEPERNHTPPIAVGSRIYEPPALLLTTYPLGEWGAPCPSSFLLRRTAFDQVEGFIESFNPSTYQLYEDTAFLAKIYLTVRVFVAESCLDKYRCHPLSIWHRTMNTNREEPERRYYFDWLQEYLSRRGITEPEIWRAVRRRSWTYSLPLPAGAARVIRHIADRLSR